MLQSVLQFILTVLRRFVGKKPTETVTVTTPAPTSSEPPSLTTSTPVSPMVAPGSNEPQRLEDEQENKLAELYPPFANLVRRFIIEARRQGMPVGIFEGVRSLERQKELFSKGRDPEGTVVDKTKVITNAPPGSSYHFYSVAADLVFDRDGTKQGMQWSWEPKYRWDKLAALGKSFGLKPGYYFKNLCDPPHFQISSGFTSAQLFDIYNKGGKGAVFKAFDQEIIGGLNVNLLHKKQNKQ
jgi:hypothetical protein